MKSYPPSHQSGRLARRLAIACVALAGLAPLRAADAAPAADVTAIDRTDFTLKFPASWKENTKDSDYKPDTNFTIQDPKKMSNIQFEILPKVEKPDDILKSALASIEGLGITVLEKTKIDEWGQFKGVGTHLKGKIFDTDPGGIKVFVLTSDHHNVLIIEYYYSAEMKDVSSDIDFINQNLVMKN